MPFGAQFQEPMRLTHVLDKTTVSVSTLPLPSRGSISASSASICAGNTATLIASGATTYTWASISQLDILFFVSPLVTSAHSVSGTGYKRFAQAQKFECFMHFNFLMLASRFLRKVCAGEEAVLNDQEQQLYMDANV